MEKYINNKYIKAYVDPRADISYASMYIDGLRRVLGARNVKFSNRYFEDVDIIGQLGRPEMVLLVVFVDADDNIHKMAIDTRDMTSVVETAYAWCDSYAKVNYNIKATVVPSTNGNRKIISIPPSFGVRLWSFLPFVCNLLHNTWLILLQNNKRKLGRISIKAYVRHYIYYYRTRLPLSIYERPSRTDDHYVFALSTLWGGETKCNEWRAAFYRICAETLNFEGGFFTTKTVNDTSLNYYYSRVPLNEYLSKTKRSAFVFNTPAVADCHGWKLGEYLTMGKAIISTPISNELPMPLVHGENIHIVTNIDELNIAVQKLASDADYRQKLEAGAKRYYEACVAPVAVINLLLNKIKER